MLGAGRRSRGVFQLHLEAPQQTGPTSRGARALSAAQRVVPHVPMRAAVLRVLLSERRRLLHRRHLREPHLQLRVPCGLRGPALRVQGLGRLVRADEPAADDGDGRHRGGRGRGGVPRASSLLWRLAPAAPQARARGGSCLRGDPGACLVTVGCLCCEVAVLLGDECCIYLFQG